MPRPMAVDFPGENRDSTGENPGFLRHEPLTQMSTAEFLSPSSRLTQQLTREATNWCDVAAVVKGGHS